MGSSFFSIILPSYNRAQFLPRAIKSVLIQDFKDWELIIVDDGSTDTTKEVVESFVKHDSRIKYIWQENAERSAARNHGISKAKGEYICFLDSDDYYLSNHLSSFKKVIEASERAKGLFFGNTFEDMEGNLNKVLPPKLPIGNPIEFFLLNVIGVPRTCIHKEVLKNYKFNLSIRIGEDTELWVRIAQEYPIFYNPEYTQAFVAHEQRTVNRKNVDHYFENLRGKRAILKKTQVSPKVRKEVMHNTYFTLAQSLEQNKQFSKMFYALLCASFYQPKKRWKEKIYMSRQLFIS